MATDKLSIILELIAGQYKKEAKEAATATGQITGAAKGATSSMGAMLGPAAIGGAILGLGRMAIAAGENADRLFDLQSQTGASTETLQEYEFVAKAAGASQEFFADAVKQVVKSLDSALAGTGAASKAYEQLGVSVTNANGSVRDAADVTEEIIAKLAGMSNVTERNALAQDIFGKKWEETVSVLDMGTDAISDLRQEAHDMGAVISTEALVGADRLRESFEKLQATASGKLMNTLGLVAVSFGSLFGDEQSTDALRFSEAVASVADELEAGVQAEAAFANGLFHIAEGGKLSREELEQLADVAGIDLKALSAEELRAYSDELRLQAEAAGFSKEAIDEVTGAVTTMAIELDIANGVIGEQHDSWRLLHPAVEEAAEDQWELGEATSSTTDEIKAQRDEVRAALDPLFALRRAAEANRDAELAYQDALREHGPASREARDAGLELISTTADLNYFAELYAANFGPAQAEAFREVARQAGISNDEIEAIIRSTDALNGKQVDIFITTHEQVQREAVEDTLIGGRAAGGPVTAGKAYTVGELGTELFVPSTSGIIVTNKQLRAAAAGTGGTVTGHTIIVQSPMRDFVPDMQLATILATIVPMVEGQ